MRTTSTSVCVAARMSATCPACRNGPNHRMRGESKIEMRASREQASACWPSSTPLPASTSRPTPQATPRPTRRGWRTHQKVRTSATKSGTSRRSFHGRKLSSNAIANEAATVLTRAGRRMCSALPPSAINPPSLLPARAGPFPNGALCSIGLPRAAAAAPSHRTAPGRSDRGRPRQPAGSKPKREHARGAASEGDCAQAVTYHLDRDDMVLVGDERDLGYERMHPCHLADDPGFVRHRAARLHALPLAEVDEDLVRVGVAPGVENL